MRILSSIISSIWNTVTFLDKEQRALVAHVLTVSQAHPKSFNYRNQTGLWESKGLKITFDKAHNEVFLSEVKYKLGWRANAILKKHFAMLHICLHHEHIGKALSEIDIAENEPKRRSVMEMMGGYTYDNQQTVGDIGKKVDTSRVSDVGQPESLYLSDYLGSYVKVTMMDGTECTGEVGKNHHDRYGIIGACIPDHHYIEDIVKIEYVNSKPVDQIWVTDIDLTKLIGKRVDVKLRNNKLVSGVPVITGNSAYRPVMVAGLSYRKNGNCWWDDADDRDIISIRLSA